MGTSRNSVSFNNSITLNSFSQYGDALTFNNLTVNGVTSNFTVTALGADIVISNYDLNNYISYTVDGIGNQTFSTIGQPPVSVTIDGKQTLTGLSYSSTSGEIMVTGATSSVVIDLPYN